MSDGSGADAQPPSTGPDDLTWLSATAIAERVRSRRVTAADVAEHFLDRIERLNPALNAFVFVDPAAVRDRARELDRRIAAGEDVGPLAGVPYSLKESTAAAGLPHTGAMAAMAGHRADHDAVVTRRLATAGGILMGKTNLPENGYRCATDNHLYGLTRNPWDLDASPGGSTGGGAASVAAGLTPVADGSDGAGSIRLPAAMCGLVGFKPSTGRIPQELLPTRFATFLSHGILARTVADVALMLDVECGPDPVDPLSLPADAVGYRDAVAEHIGGAADLRGWRVAWSPDLGFGRATDPEILALCEAAIATFADLGASVVEAAPAWGDPQQAMWEGVWLPAYAPDLDYYDWPELERTGMVDPELAEIVRAGAAQSGERIAAADLQRSAVYRAYATFMADHELLVSPTTRIAGFPADEFGPPDLADAPLSDRILGWINTYPFNLTGTPAISVPVGFTSGGLPVGLQIAGGHLADARVLQAAAAFERMRPWSGQRPAHS